MGRGRKRVVREVKLQLEGGRATPAPPVGRDLGPHGIDLAEFCKQFNDATRDQQGAIIPVNVSIYEDRTFGIVTKTPTTAYLLRRAAGVEKGSCAPGHNGGGCVTGDQLREIAETKMPDLNASSVEAAMRVIAGSARSMGLKVEGVRKDW